MVMAYRPQDLRPNAYGKDTRPLPPHAEDVERWALFCSTVDARIEAIRDEESPLPRQRPETADLVCAWCSHPLKSKQIRKGQRYCSISHGSRAGWAERRAS